MSARKRKQPRRGAKKLVNLKAYVHHDDFVECRLWQHAWSLAGALEVTRQGIVWPLRCTRCGARRKDVTAKRSGALDGRSYATPAGYLWKGVGQQKPTRSELRAAYAEHLLTRRNGK